jgi:2-polyprenyl-3-methyl-5-hydroxy-6-metoxy-1,4-benzoquinol methylase
LKIIREYQRNLYDSFLPEIISNSLKGKKVLDAGCGTGDLSFWVSKKGATVTGIDISEKAIQIARKRMKGRFVVSDIADMKGTYDMVMCVGVLHHNKNPGKLFSKLAGLTKKGGRIVIGVYYKYGRIRHKLKRFFVHLLAGPEVKRRVETAYQLFYRDLWKIRKNVPKLARQVDVIIADQFAHPIESSHSKSEIRKWFTDNGVELDKILVRKGFLWASGVKH